MKKLIEKALDKWLAKQSWDAEAKEFIKMLVLAYLFGDEE